MLSVIDLLEAGTIPGAVAAYALATIGRGASFLVGASPGGAGKTTVMGALLNFVPPGTELAPADGPDGIEKGMTTQRRHCYVCHEIGPGPYYAYLWGEDLAAYFRLPAAGHMLAANLHADTPQEARRQIVQENRVPDEHFRAMNLMFFLSVSRQGGGIQRRIVEVWESDGQCDHQRVYALPQPSAGDGPAPIITSKLVSPDDLARAAATLAALRESGARTIEEVRSFLI